MRHETKQLKHEVVHIKINFVPHRPRESQWIWSTYTKLMQTMKLSRTLIKNCFILRKKQNTRSLGLLLVTKQLESIQITQNSMTQRSLAGWWNWGSYVLSGGIIRQHMGTQVYFRRCPDIPDIPGSQKFKLCFTIFHFLFTCVK